MSKVFAFASPILLVVALEAAIGGPAPSEGAHKWTLKTRYARLTIDAKGFITSLKSVASKKE